jgi:phenylpropionate dioxygenase-like ring-hydroxylating dioxygenase large terminal subunit
MRRNISEQDIAAMVGDTRVHRDAYASPEVFDLEMERVFGRAWLLLGHDSQIKQTGDYFTTTMGRQPVIVSRTSTGAVKVLYNRCAHRGPVICSNAKGSVSQFVCPYHGWTYELDGKLVAVPVPDGYPAGNDPRHEGLSMVEVASVELYRGFIFARLAASGPTLKQFLGPIISSFDDMVDRAPDGEIEVAGGISRHAYNGNWKFMLENHLDGLHPRYVHASSVAAANAQDDNRPTDGAGEVGVRQMRQNGAPSEMWENIGLWAVANGHGFMGDYHDDEKLVKVSDDPVHVEYRQRMEAVHGEKRAREILAVTRWNTIVFPNVSFMSQFAQLRILRPLAVDRSVVDTYVFRLKGAPEEMFLRSIAFANVVNGTGSPVLTDDLEVYERMQTGLTTDGTEWVDYARGFGRDIHEPAGLDRGGTGTSEIAIRNQFAAWRDYLTNSGVASAAAE